MQRKVFRGVGAMIVNPATNRRFQIFTKITDPQEFDFHPSRSIEVDLGRTPSRTSWDLVHVDDRGIDAQRVPLATAACPQALEGFHVTSIGGSLSEDRDELWRGCLVGAVYLESSYFDQVRGRIDLPSNRWPCDDRKTYQLTSIAYQRVPENGARKGLRYHGFEARLVSAGADGIRRVELFDIFATSIGEFELDFTNPLHIDDQPEIDADERALGLGSSVNDFGAIYIELAQIATLLIGNPKLPIGLEE